MDSSSESLEAVELLADEFMARQRKGEQPTIQEYVDRHPELADEIRDVFPALVMMEQVAPASADLFQSEAPGKSGRRAALEHVGDYRIIREIGRGGMGVVYEAEQESLRRRVALKVLPRHQAGDDKSLERFQREARAAARMHHTNIVPVFEVGEDGEWVFYAMQLIQGQGLDLVVEDLKRIRGEHSILKRAATPDGCVAAVPSRAATAATPGSHGESPAPHSIAASLIAGHFEQENLVLHEGQEEDFSAASAAAPTIASDSEALRACVETIQQESGSTASAVLPGQSELSSAETNRRGYFQSVAEIGLQTARALSYAHARGIIHRDIKPSNLLLDTAGTVWVTDFGLAKTGDEAMTHTGDILGTIRYMSPERFRGECDVRADIYALGLTLYELLALKPAFQSPDRLKLIDLVSKTQPDALRSLDPRIPRDLETVILKCIDKDPRRRYQSADDLADDLQRCINDEPVHARRISLVERFARWSRRNKPLTASLIGTALALLIGTGVATWQAVEAHRALAEAQQSQEDARLSAAKEDAQRQIAEQARRQARQAKLESMEALNAALRKMQLQPNNPDVRILLAHQLLKQNLRKEARIEFEKAVALDSKRVDVATELAKLIMDVKPVEWTVLRPVEMTSQGGETLSLEKDGSVFVSGPNPDRAVYVLKFKTDLPRVSALRLETLPDPRLSNGATGRGENGNWNLAELTMTFQTSDKGRPKTIPISRARADFHTPGEATVLKVIDGNLKSFWDTWPMVKQPHWATFDFEALPKSEKGILIVTLDGGTRWKQHGLGRFRLSAASQPAGFEKGPLLLAVSAGEIDGFAALGAAYLLEGNSKKAESAYATALKQAKDESARAKIIQHVPAIEILDRLVRSRPDDPLFRVAIARKLVERNRTSEARSHLEKALVLAPANVDAASELALLIANHARGTRTWTVLKPQEMKSEGGATLKLLPDGSILAGGVNPRHDRYIIRAPAGASPIRAIMLEALPHPSLPKGGFGRDVNGSFFLHEFTLHVDGGKAGEGVRAIRLFDGVANYSRGPTSQAQHAVDGNPSTWWDPWPEVHKPLRAIFSVAEPDGTAGNTLVFELLSRSTWPHCALGCFRLSATSDPSVAALARLRIAIEKGDLNGFAALAVARLLEGKTTAGIAAIRTALRTTSDATIRATILKRAVLVEEVRKGLLAARPNDPEVHMAVGRYLEERNLRREAQTEFEQVLSLDPANVSAASELADLILASKQAKWTVLKPAKMKGQGGETFSLEKDGSIFVSGPNPDRAVYTIRLKPGTATIGAIRLETLPDARLPRGGAGRHSTGVGAAGSFVLSEFTAAMTSADGKRESTPIPLSSAMARYSKPSFPVSNAIDGDAKTFWDTYPKMREPNWAVFACSAPVPTKSGDLIVTLDSGVTPFQQHGLGRFRLSVLGDPADWRLESVRLAAKNLADPWEQLAAAYHITGNKTAFEKLVAEKPDARLGLAKVLRKANRLKEARALLERALSLAPQNAGAASELGDLILQSTQAEWTVVKPVEMKSTGGARMTLEPDGSIFVSGRNPDLDTYRITAKPTKSSIVAVRLETIPDPRLPRGGSGRSPSGGFVLSRFSLFPTKAGAARGTFEIADAFATHEEHPVYGIKKAIDRVPDTAWSPFPRQAEPQSAVFVLKNAVAPGDGIQVELEFHHPHRHIKKWVKGYNIGRFRLSILGDPAELRSERLRFAARKLTDPWERLALAYYASRDRVALSRLVERKPECRLAVIGVCLEAGDRDGAAAQYTMLRPAGEFSKALVFNGSPEFVTARRVPFDTYEAFTIEAWVAGWNGQIFWEGAGGDPENSIYLTYGRNIPWRYSGWESGRGTNHDFELPFQKDLKWRHVAMTFDGKQQRFFVDGQLLSAKVAPKPGPLNKSEELRLGVGGAIGLLGGFRVSRVARYTADFTPPKTFQSDPQTVLLYDMSQTADGSLQDRSPEQRHGTIPDKRWLVTANVLSTDAEAAREFQLGDVQQARGDLKAAIAHYRKAIASDAGFALAHCRLGLAYRDQRNFAEALKSLQKGHDLGSKKPGWPYPSAEWLEDCKRLPALDRRASAVLQGEDRPRDSSELAELGSFARRYRAPEDAARLLQRALALDPKNAKAHCELGLLYRDRGKLAAALKSLQKGHDLGSKDPNWKEPSAEWLVKTAADLGNSLLNTGNGWKTLKPVEMKGKGGETFTLQKDGSIFVSGPNPDRAVYTLRFKPGKLAVSAVRLETLPDPRRTDGAVGRQPISGNFHLAEFTAAFAPANGTGQPRAIPISRGVADYSNGNVVTNAIDGNPRTLWSTYPQHRQQHWAAFEFKDPFRSEKGDLVITLDSGDTGFTQGGLGRFRISFLAAPAQLEREIRRLQARKLTDPWARLAAAYYIAGDKAAFDKLTAAQPHSLLTLGQLLSEWKDEKRSADFYRRFLRATGFADAMLFDGRGTFVIAPHVPFDTYKAFTVEAWVAGWDDVVFGQGLHGDPENSISLGFGTVWTGWESGLRGTNFFRTLPALTTTDWRHVAMTWDGRQRRIFLDGRLMHADTVPKPGPLTKSRLLNLGVLEYRRSTGPYGTGLLAGFRISRIARYSAPFTPSRQWRSDAGTVLLYDLSQPNIRGLQDQSGNRRHGTIYGSRRLVHADPGQAAAREQSLLASTPDDVDTYYYVAIGHLGAGRLAEYRATTKQLVARLKSTTSPGVASRILYTLVSQAGDSDDFAKLLPLAKLGASAWTGNERILAAALYRAGQPKEAVRQFAAQKTYPAKAWDYLFLAMAHHKLGDKSQAMKYADRAARWMKTAWVPWTERIEQNHLAEELGRMDPAYRKILGTTGR
jgi:serine/threonine protein kinase/Flp pilus assembly protein TadD